MIPRSEPVICIETFHVPVTDLWSAITDQEQMKEWYFDQIDQFVPEVGGLTQFVIEHEGLTFTHVWKVTEAIPNKKIAYSWSYKEYDGEGQVSFDLEEMGDTVQLTLTNKGLDSFPDHIPAFSRESCVNGWTYLISTRLKEFME